MKRIAVFYLLLVLLLIVGAACTRDSEQAGADQCINQPSVNSASLPTPRHEVLDQIARQALGLEPITEKAPPPTEKQEKKRTALAEKTLK